METYLVVSALGEDRPGLVKELAVNIAESGCSIKDSRMVVLGSEFAISQNPHMRKGGLIGLAAMAIGLGMLGWVLFRP